MSELRKRAGWLMLLGPLLVLVASLSLGYLWNEDFFWYLTSGQAVLEAGGIPEADPFLYTSGEGIGWVYHSWLWTVLVALVEGVAGLGGVVLFHALVAGAIVVLLYTSARVDRWGLANALAALLFVVAARFRLCGKAELATWLCLVLFFLVLEKEGAFTWRRAAVLGVLQVLWANLHGGYPLGIAIAACYAAGGWLEARGRRASERPSGRPPLWLPVLLFVLAIADPRMFRERLAPFGFVAGSERLQPLGESGTLLITEWRSPFDASLTDASYLWLFLVSLAAGAASFLYARRWPLPRLFFLGLMAALGASAIRHAGALALAAALVALANLGDAARERRAAGVERDGGKKEGRKGKGRRAAGKRRLPGAAHLRWLYPAACLLTAAFALASAAALRIARPGYEVGEPERFFTVRPSIHCPGAADFIARSGAPAPIFNDYQSGAYLSHRLYPDYRMYVDSRVLDTSVVVEYTELVQSESAWRRAEQKYGFRTAVLGTSSTTVRSPLGRALQQDPAWRLAYLDPLAVVYVKGGDAASRGEAAFELEDPERVPFLDPPGYSAPVAALQHLYLNDEPSNHLVELLAILGQLGKAGEVYNLASLALERMPGHPLLHRQRCAANLVLGRLEAALDDCETAHDARPDDPQIAFLYANALERSGNRRGALYVLDKALREHPKDGALRDLRRRLGGGG